MRNGMRAIGVMAMAMSLGACDSLSRGNAAEEPGRPAIVLVAFGTSEPEARKVFDHIDAVARQRYPDHDIRWAFTSKFIRDKLRKQGIELHSLDEVVADLKKDGCRQAVFQSLHVAPGQEYSEIHNIDTAGLKVAVGKALLADEHDIRAAIDAIRKDIDPAAANVVACHGNDRYPEFNQQLVAFAGNIEAAHSNVFVCSVEGQPGTGKLADARRLARKTGRAHFIPLMIVAGDHIMNDVMGDEEDAWVKQVGAAESSCARPLGYNDAIVEIYFKHLDAAMAALTE